MGAFRYVAVETGGGSVRGVIEAADRKSALELLAGKGMFASELEACAADAKSTAGPSEAKIERGTGFRFGSGISRKQVTAFTREIASLLSASIPIPQALDGLAEEEENPAMRAVLKNIAESVRKGVALSAAMDEHPRVFNKLYTSMLRVGEEAGALPRVMNELSSLLEHEDEIRSEVVAAVSYPLFVMGFGIVTVIVLLTVVLPKLFAMLQEMLKVLPLPTLILLRTSTFLQTYWPILLIASVVGAFSFRWFKRTPNGARTIDQLKLRLPIMGGVFMASALSRFTRTLGTLVKSGISLLPALKIVENTIGNIVLAQFIAQVAEETRGGDSLARPLKKIGVFPRTVVQMISVGEESGKLDEMLLKVAEIQEREMRAKTKTLISLLAPILILIVGAVVGFMVIALLLPIFSMSRAVR
jgi:general secretion pathway protein F